MNIILISFKCKITKSSWLYILFRFVDYFANYTFTKFQLKSAYTQIKIHFKRSFKPVI